MAGQGAILLAAVLMSTTGLSIKLLDWHPLVITCARSFFAALSLVVIRLIFPPPKEAKNEPFPLWTAAILFSLTMITFIIANKLTTSANAILLQYGAPVWAALLGWRLVREKPYWEHWGALVLVIVGLVLFFRDSLGSGAFAGNILAIISGVLFGANSVFLRMMKKGNPSDSFLLGHAITAVVAMPFFFLYPPTLSFFSSANIFYMGAIQMGLVSLLFSYGIKRVRAIQTMLIASAEPILNPVWVFLVTGERPSPGALAGGIIIIFAVVSSSLIGSRRVEAIQ